jgi:hypothetical protein
MSFAQAKARMRRVVHDTMAVDATYLDATMVAAVGLRVRFHTRRVSAIGGMGDGYAEVIENAERIVFDVEELTAAGVTPIKGGIVTLTDDGFCLRLVTLDEATGPVEQIWTAVR